MPGVPLDGLSQLKKGFRGLFKKKPKDQVAHAPEPEPELDSDAPPTVTEDPQVAVNPAPETPADPSTDGIVEKGVDEPAKAPPASSAAGECECLK